MMASPMMEALLAWLTRTSFQVALLVLMVLLVQRCLRRWMSPRARYGLWMLVVLRLCLPLQFEVAGGSWTPAARQQASAMRVPPAIAPPAGKRSLVVHTVPGMPAHAAREPKPLQAPLELVAVESAEPQESGLDARGSERLDRGPSAPFSVAQAPLALRSSASFGAQLAQPVAPRWAGAGALLLWIWAIGAGLCLLRALLLEYLFRRRLRGARRVKDPRVLQALREAEEVLGQPHKLACVQTNLLSSPAVHGLWNKRILLPEHVLESFSGDELRLLFLHELSHVRRHDLELNLLLVLLSALFWFHPLVHLGLARLRDAQEALRDWEALGSSAHPSPQLYAGTLIKLIERTKADIQAVRGVGFLLHGRTLKERILMITHFSSPHPHVRFLGGFLALPLVWLAFTSSREAGALAQAPPDDSQVASSASFSSSEQSALRQIRVASHQELPGWQQRIHRELLQPISVVLKRVTLEEAIDAFRAHSGLNFVISSDVLDNQSERFDMEIENTSVSDALDLLCRTLSSDLQYCLAGEALYLGYAGELPLTYLTYVYNIDELLGGEAAGDREEALEYLSCLVTECVNPESWDSASVRAWGDLLVVSQTHANQIAVKHFLNLLLNRGPYEQSLSLDSAKALNRQLQSQQVDVRYQDLPLSSVAAQLREAYGLDLFVEPDRVEERINLTLTGVSMNSMLNFLAASSGLNLWTQAGRVYLTEGCDATWIEVYSIVDLIESYASEPGGADQEALEGLHELIRESVSPNSWDAWGALWDWDGMLVVRQSEGVHAELKAFLGDLRAAMNRGTQPGSAASIGR